MLRRFMDWQMSLVADGKPLAFLRPLVSAGDTFMFEPGINTKKAPHIRDAVDLKRWMVLVVLGLLPCVLFAIWNTGVQALVYEHGTVDVMQDYLRASSSFEAYSGFAGKYWLQILQFGLLAFVPIVIISYAVGGLCEAFFAVIRKHEIAEGFLVTGMLYPLVLPSTCPYWLVAVGVIFGVVIGKELFGGTGMNIMNPALTCRAFLFFAYPSALSGDVWVGTSASASAQNLAAINAKLTSMGLDGVSMATAATRFHAHHDIQRIHVDAIKAAGGLDVSSLSAILARFKEYAVAHGWPQFTGDTGLLAVFKKLSPEQIKGFVTAPIHEAGLGLGVEHYEAARNFVSLEAGTYNFSNWNLFLGNMAGSMGETSTLACLLGAGFLVLTGVGAWRTMVAVVLGALGTAGLFEFLGPYFGSAGALYNPAVYSFPAYKHLLMGGLAFGLVFMATDPVSSPTMNSAKWVYGFFIGMMTVVIRVINPAFPEGVMLSIMLGNVAAPLIDYYAVRAYRRPHVRAA